MGTAKGTIGSRERSPLYSLCLKSGRDEYVTDSVHRSARHGPYSQASEEHEALHAKITNSAV